jgi:hypothetical protein
MIDAKFIKPIYWSLRVVFIVLILYALRQVVFLLYAADLNNTTPSMMRITEVMAGGTLFDGLVVLILSIVGFVSTFGISRCKEWSRIALIGVFTFFSLFILYKISSIFYLQIIDNYDSPVVDLSKSYFKILRYVIYGSVFGAIIYYFRHPKIRNVFKST